MYVSIKDYSLFQSVYSVKEELISKNDTLQNKSFYLKYKTNILEDNKTLYEYKNCESFCHSSTFTFKNNL